MTYPTQSGVSYRVLPRGSKTDRWYMRMEGNNSDVNYQTLKYYRAHKHNFGKVYFKNHTLVASFTCQSSFPLVRSCSLPAHWTSLLRSVVPHSPSAQR